MIGLDTNVLVRFVLQDDPVQSAQVVQFFTHHNGHANSLFVNNIVLCELVWVLRRGYKYNKSQIMSVLTMLLNIQELSFQDHDIIVKAVAMYADGGGDLADYLIMNVNRQCGCLSTVSFDQKIIRETLFIQHLPNFNLGVF